MLNYHLSFQSPGYLLLLAVIPVLWWLSFRALAGLGPVRRWLALLARTALLGAADARPGGSPDRPRHRPVDGDLPAGPIAEHSRRPSRGDAPLRHRRGAEASEEGRPGGRDRLRARRRHRNSPLRLPHAVDEDRDFHRSRVHQHRRRDEAGPGHVCRGRRQADRPGHRRQREPRQRRRAGRGHGGHRHRHRRAAHPLPQPGRGGGRARGAAPRRPPQPALRPPRGRQQPHRAAAAGTLRRGPRQARALSIDSASGPCC